MATGDIKNNLRKLMVELKQIRFPLTKVDLKGLSLGTPRCFLPILHYIFLDYSVDLTEFFAKDYELYGKTDLRFVETVYKILRDVFHYKPPLTREQFLSLGYSERKIIELCDILKKCREKNAELNPKTSKTEKKHPQGKCKMSQAEKEVGCHPLINVLEKRELLQNEFSKKNRNGNDILKKAADANKGDSSVCEDFHLRGVSKQVESVRGKEAVEQKSCIKSVRWKEDEESTLRLNEVSSVSLSAALTEINSSIAQATNAPTVSTVMSTSMQAPPKTIPVPVTMTTIPKPSPELMLKPIGKTRHQAIPLSGSRHNHGDAINVSLIDLTDSMNVQQPKVVRHGYSFERETQALRSMDNQDSLLAAKDNEVKLLKDSVQELQEKLDAVLSQNNEMSARVVLLESRVKLLEEAVTRNQCANCMNSDFALPNYNVSMNPFYSHVPASGIPTNLGNNSTISANPQIKKQQNSVSCSTASSHRNLMNEFADSQNNLMFQNANVTSNNYRDQRSSGHVVEVPHASLVTEISDDEDDGLGTSTVNTSSVSPKGSSLSCTPNKSTGTSIEAISPFTSQEIHLRFSDPSTTATIMNVERRLQETREMLANAARFAVTNLP